MKCQKTRVFFVRYLIEKINFFISFNKTLNRNVFFICQNMAVYVFKDKICVKFQEKEII